MFALGSLGPTRARSRALAIALPIVLKEVTCGRCDTRVGGRRPGECGRPAGDVGARPQSARRRGRGGSAGPRCCERAAAGDVGTRNLGEPPPRPGKLFPRYRAQLAGGWGGLVVLCKRARCEYCVMFVARVDTLSRTFGAVNPLCGRVCPLYNCMCACCGPRSPWRDRG